MMNDETRGYFEPLWPQIDTLSITNLNISFVPTIQDSFSYV